MARWFSQDIVVIEKCPPRRQYDPSTVKQMGRELSGLIARDPKAVTPSIVRDASTLRAQCDAIEKKPPIRAIGN